jgi:uncharacterized membrane protein (DUF2068 family)
MFVKGNSASRTKHHKGVLIIAILKLLKGIFLLAVGLGAISLLHRDVAQIAEHWMLFFRLDPGGKFFDAVIDKVALVNDHRLRQVSAGTFFYAAVVLTEGTGLLLEKRWAEWVTVLFTGSFVPFEIYEICHRFSLAKVAVLLVNIVIVIYLILRLRDRPEKPAQQ